MHKINNKKGKRSWIIGGPKKRKGNSPKVFKREGYGLFLGEKREAGGGEIGICKKCEEEGAARRENLPSPRVEEHKLSYSTIKELISLVVTARGERVSLGKERRRKEKLKTPRN